MTEINESNLLRERELLIKKLAIIDAALLLYREVIPKGTARQPVEKKLESPDPEYPLTSSWNDRIRYVMKKCGTAVTAKEIADKMKQLEPGTDDKLITTQVTQNTSTMATNSNKSGVVAERIGNRNKYSLK